MPALLPLLRDPDPLVRETVEETLEVLDPDDVAVPEAEALLAAAPAAGVSCSDDSRLGLSSGGAAINSLRRQAQEGKNPLVY